MDKVDEQMNPLISVIIPVYNVVSYMDECIKSVCSQSYDNLEILLVDDGSTDKSGERCDEWAQCDQRIVALHKSNGGLSDARNYALERITGKYITFIDSDDIVSQNYIEYLYNLIIDTGAEISICDPVHYFGEGQYSFQKESCRETYSAIDGITELLYQRSFLVSACGKLYKSQCYASIRFPKGKLFEDSAVMYKVFETAKRITYGNAKLYMYRHRENSITTQPFSVKLYDIWDICKTISKHYSGVTDNRKQAAQAYQSSAALRIILNDTNGSGSKYKECVDWLKSNALQVIMDRRARTKNRVALLMFLLMPRSLARIYPYINKWK